MGEMRGRVAMVVVLAAIAVAVGALMGRSPVPVATSTSDSGSPTRTPEDSVAVHVSGMVVSPGVVDVPEDAIVADAVEAAGGLLSGALVDQINLAAPIIAGEQIVVPGSTGGTMGGGGGDDGVLSINQASPTDLESLPGVGPVLAERIVSHREANGRFEAVEDLLEVPGIGEAKLEAIRDLVRP